MNEEILNTVMHGDALENIRNVADHSLKKKASLRRPGLAPSPLRVLG
jgi:hypothetical protein